VEKMGLLLTISPRNVLVSGWWGRGGEAGEATGATWESTGGSSCVVLVRFKDVSGNGWTYGSHRGRRGRLGIRRGNRQWGQLFGVSELVAERERERRDVRKPPGPPGNPPVGAAVSCQ
jgi:hypothetical protein